MKIKFAEIPKHSKLIVMDYLEYGNDIVRYFAVPRKTKRYMYEDIYMEEKNIEILNDIPEFIEWLSQQPDIIEVELETW